MADHTPQATLDEVIAKLHANRVLAHRVLFAHRHPDASPPFHKDMIDLWHGAHPRAMLMAFRGAAKSTLSEEAITIEACLNLFHNALIVGESFERAAERLASVKHEIESNDMLREIFGDLVGSVWQYGKVELRNGVVIQAVGRGQSLRGVKHLDRRPDRVFADDLEDEESVATPDARRKTMAWFTKTLLPALAPDARLRIAATPLDREALAVVLARDPAWHTLTVPIETVHPETGERVASWPDRFPLTFIDETKASYGRLGMNDAFMQEYMCQAEDPAQKVFTPDQLRVEAVPRTWHAVYAFYDPARTTHAKSATTGRAVWSWVGNRLIVWELDGLILKPDEMIDDMFSIDDRYSPVAIGVEEDGLNEFLLQPLRQRQVDRAHPLPLRPMRAPKGKLDFIKSLQPFFKAGEVIFTRPFAQAWEQFLGYPTGRIDAPNALAYALKMRPGAPIYDGFHQENIVSGTEVVRREPVWLVLNATQTCTTGALVQHLNGQLRLIADWAREGDPGTVVAGIVTNASMEAGKAVRVVAPASHFSSYDTVGLRAALRRIPVDDVRKGGPEHVGREEIRQLLGRTVSGRPALVIDDRASWSLRGIAGGYARALDRGVVSDFAADGPYRVLWEGIEAFAALMRIGTTEEVDSDANFAYTANGRRYRSAFAGRT